MSSHGHGGVGLSTPFCPQEALNWLRVTTSRWVQKPKSNPKPSKPKRPTNKQNPRQAPPTRDSMSQQMTPEKAWFHPEVCQCHSMYIYAVAYTTQDCMYYVVLQGAEFC